MSDVTNAPSAPPPAAPSAPAAPQQVPINQNPTTSPNAVPSQAPPADEKPSGRPESRREGLERAFAKHRADNPAPPREARKGDNSPPEDTPDEKFDLKKRPSDQTAKIDQPRDRGRFAARPASDAQPGADAARQAARPGQQAAPRPYTPPPGAPAHHHPIARMSDRAKADWDKVPDTVRADAHRLYNEVDQAFRRYKADHDTMNTLRPYHDMARQQGTTLDRVLNNHVAIEEKLRTDPIGAFEVITHNLNLQTPDGQKLSFRDLAWHALNQTPEQQQLINQRNEAQALRIQMQQMRAEQQALVNEHRRAQYVQHFQTTRGAVDRYADQQPRFDELGDLIHREIQLGFSLDEAYRRADLLRPATAAQTRAQTPAQTRAPDRSISGAPNGSPNGAARTGKPVTRMDAIKRAVNHHRGGV